MKWEIRLVLYGSVGDGMERSGFETVNLSWVRREISDIVLKGACIVYGIHLNKIISTFYC